MSNKSNRTAIALIVGLIICVVLFALIAPKTFNWDLPPQNRNTEQPFAQTVMHDVLSHSFQHGYRVSDDLAQTLRQQRKDTCENLIVCLDDYNPAEEINFTQLDRMARLAKSGRRIIYTSVYNDKSRSQLFRLDRRIRWGRLEFRPQIER